MQAAAFKAAYSDFKLVKTRRVVQVILEVPLEAADEALLALGGMPKPDTETWVGVARLDAKPIREETTRIEAPKAKRRFNELPPAQQAAMRCNEAAFHRFLAEHCTEPCENPADAAFIVRKVCGVQTRADLLPESPEGRRWQSLEGAFRAWMSVS